MSKHAKVVRLELSVGDDDSDRTLEQFVDDLRDLIKTHVHNVTYQGGNYIINGKVCLARDYDPATKDFKPGSYPPPWAGGPTDAQKVTAPVEDTTEEPQEYVRVKPTKNNERLPNGRRVRRDKGVKRGPRSVSTDTLNPTAQTEVTSA